MHLDLQLYRAVYTVFETDLVVTLHDYDGCLFLGRQTVDRSRSRHLTETCVERRDRSSCYRTNWLLAHASRTSCRTARVWSRSRSQHGQMHASTCIARIKKSSEVSVRAHPLISPPPSPPKHLPRALRLLSHAAQRRQIRARGQTMNGSALDGAQRRSALSRCICAHFANASPSPTRSLSEA